MPIKGECVFNNDVPNTLHDEPIPENITPEIDPEEVPIDEGPEALPEVLLDEPEEVPDEHQFDGYSEQQMIEADYSGDFPERCFSPDFIRRMEDEDQVVEVTLTLKPENDEFIDDAYKFLDDTDYENE